MYLVEYNIYSKYVSIYKHTISSVVMRAHYSYDMSTFFLNSSIRYTLDVSKII